MFGRYNNGINKIQNLENRTRFRGGYMRIIFYNAGTRYEVGKYRKCKNKVF